MALFVLHHPMAEIQHITHLFPLSYYYPFRWNVIIRYTLSRVYVKGSFISHTARNVRDAIAKCSNTLNQRAHFSYKWSVHHVWFINVVRLYIEE